MATRIKLNELEQRILDRILLSGDGFEPVEDLLAAIGAERNQFVDALENLEGAGCLSVSNFGGSIVVGCDDPLRDAYEGIANSGLICASRVGHC